MSGSSAADRATGSSTARRWASTLRRKFSKAGRPSRASRWRRKLTCASARYSDQPESLRYAMCRNIRTLFNFEPPVTDEEIHAAALQFVRKVSGFARPSKANEGVFLAAVDDVAAVSRRLLNSLETSAPPKNREEEIAKARARAAQRFS